MDPVFHDLALTHLSARPPDSLEPFVHLPYAQEISLKNKVLKEYWIRSRLPLVPEAVVPSPLPREYRTTTKRRVSTSGGGPLLAFGPSARNRGARPAVPSSLEPKSHQRIYSLLGGLLRAPANASAARALNFIIVRGTYREHVLILNVRSLSGPIVRGLRRLAEQARASVPLLTTAFIFHDPTGSDYYLETQRGPAPLRTKKLFGYDEYEIECGGCRLRVDPRHLSQVNESLVTGLLQAVGDLLRPRGADTLLDLFCGYGLFSFSLAPSFPRICGVDSAPRAIACALKNCRRLAPKAGMRFLCRDISGDSLQAALPGPGRGAAEDMILDPPKNGVEAGVVAYCASRGPRRAVHLCCGIDEVPRTVRAWQACGYALARAVPLDLFAGTANLETALLFTASCQGL